MDAEKQQRKFQIDSAIRWSIVTWLPSLQISKLNHVPSSYYLVLSDSHKYAYQKLIAQPILNGDNNDMKQSDGLSPTTC